MHSHHDTPAYRTLEFWLLIGVALLMLTAGALTAVKTDDTGRPAAQNHAATSDSGKPEDNPDSTGQIPEEAPKAYRNDTQFYGSLDAYPKLADDYTNALAKSVKDKDAAACQDGLAKFRKGLQEAPTQVIDMLKETKGVPTNPEALHPKRAAWVCKTALGIDLMSGLTPNSTENIEHALDVSTELANQGDYQGCYEVMYHDYVGYFYMLDRGTRIWISYTMLALPAELTNEHLARMCGYTLPANTKSI